jgi:hypothetical protein
MKAAFLSAACLLAVAEASAIPGGKQVVPGVVAFDIRRTGEVSPLRKRDTNLVTLANNRSYGGYLTTVQLGTPPQSLTLHVDTGSSDTWVPSTRSNLCRAGECIFGGCTFPTPLVSHGRRT